MNKKLPVIAFSIRKFAGFSIFAVIFLFLTLMSLSVASQQVRSRKGKGISDKSDGSSIEISRNEGVKNTDGTDAFSDNFHLDAFTKKIVKNKQNANFDVVAKLNARKKKSSKNIESLRRILKAAKSNPKRFNKLVAIAQGRKTGGRKLSKAGARHIEGTVYVKHAKANKKHVKISEKHAAAKREKTKIQAKHKTYKKVQAKVGTVGKILSIYDATQGAFYEGKDGKVHFSKSKFLANAVMNLSGASGFVGAYKTGMEAKEKAFLNTLDEYEKAGLDITNPAVVNKALLRATGKGLLIGTYNGAKCIPLAGDLIAVGELTEASVGLVHDTLQSNRIQAENEVVQKEQGRSAVSKLKMKFENFKACKEEFGKLQVYSDAMMKNFKSLRNQYVKVFNRSVQCEKGLVSGDALLKAAKIAEPYMDGKRIETLKINILRMTDAVVTTVKLAEATLENYNTNGGDPAVLKKTAAELAKMTETLVAYKNECETTTKALTPLLNGGKTLKNTKELTQIAEADSIISGDLHGTALDILKAHRRLVKRGKLLKQAQAGIMRDAKSALSHFYLNGDFTTKSDLEIAFRNVLQYKIDDYSIKKLKEKQKSMTFTFQDLRGATPIPEGIPENIVDNINLAIKLIPALAQLQNSIDSTIEIANNKIKLLMGSNALPEIAKNKVKIQFKKYSDTQLANMSTEEINSIKHTELEKAHGYHQQKGNATFNADKILESGTVDMKNPNTGKYEQKKYSILYHKGWDSMSGGGGWRPYFQKGSLKNSILKHSIHSNAKRIKPFSIPNAEVAYISYANENMETLYAYAGIGVFIVRTNLTLEYKLDNRTYSVPYGGMKNIKRDYPWKYVSSSDKNRLWGRMAYWRGEMLNEVKAYQNSRLETAKQLIDYTDKHCYKKPAKFLKILNGFDKIKLNYNETSARRDFKKRWEFEDGYSYSFSMDISAYTWFPGYSHSWNSYKERDIKVMTKNNSNLKIIKMAGVDFAMSNCTIENKTKKFKNGNIIFLKKINGTVRCLKNNVIITLSYYGTMPANEDIDPMRELKKVLSQMNKPSIK